GGGWGVEAGMGRGDAKGDRGERIIVGGFRFETDVIEGTYRPRQWPGWGGWGRAPQTDPRATRNGLLRGGISVSDERHNDYGTLGGLVGDRVSGRPMVLSHRHGLVGGWQDPRG